MSLATNHIDDFDAEKMKDSKEMLVPGAHSDVKLKIFNSSMNVLTHILIGCTVAIAVLFTFREGEMNATRIHIILCVLGYQLLMAESILSLSPHNGWSSSLKLVHKRRAHWILQLLGSGLAIAGSIIKILDKSIHWNTLHGQFALVAMVFTGVSFINGLASLYAYELRRLIPGVLSKITHIIFGTVAFVSASISLCYGFDKNSFRTWSTSEMADTFIAFTAIFTFVIIVNPLVVFFDKTVKSFQR
ncbi:uncharacterized protein LOC106135751 [Amyelois transitella]|uniref:uncharacterized protein LOC106135751 n=1 Tax=Amyelois transitella TaxID=680683 RepID=UPI00067CAD94|nr:uncharacterized protein LOC106135751 [Amyelois transitella]